MNTSTIHEHLTALADPLRCRMLLLLERQRGDGRRALLGAPASPIHRESPLEDLGGCRLGRVTTGRHQPDIYSGTDGRVDSIPPQLWDIVRDEIRLTPAAKQDAQRLESVLATRRSKSQAFFASAAGQWDRTAHRALRAKLLVRSPCFA